MVELLSYQQNTIMPPATGLLMVTIHNDIIHQDMEALKQLIPKNIPSPPAPAEPNHIKQKPEK
ncbi:hypothetical protein WDU94_014267 [Cyamophila willieti]